MEIKTTTLKNGLRIITTNRPQTESVSVGFWVRTGAAYEKPEENGISHFIEHMVFKGTKNRSSRQISEEIENVGGQSNAYTSREITAFYARVLKNDLHVALDVISDLILNPTFPENEMIKEKDVVIQEIKQSIDAPDELIFDFFQQQAFPDQPLGRTILGSEKNVLSFKNQNMFDYMNSHYAAENIVCTAAGNLNHDELVKMVEERFSDFRAKTNFAIPSQNYRGGVSVTKKDIEQTHFLLGFKGYNHKHKNYMPMLVLSTIFGGGMSSRLFQEIREKRGLVYTIYSFANSHSSSGTFGIYAGTTAQELQTLIPVLLDEIKKIQNDPVSDIELERAKAQIKASIFMSLESSSASAEMIARHHLIYGRLLTSDEIMAKINAITKEDLLSTARELFSSNPNYTLLGNFDKYPSYDEIKKNLEF